MQKQLLRLFLVLGVLGLSAWLIASTTSHNRVSAQDYDLDTTLARAAVRGFFGSLSIDTQGRQSLANFYLHDDVATADAVATLFDQPPGDYEITVGTWLSDDVYQATVNLEPTNTVAIVEVAQQDNMRWLIVDLSLGSPAADALTLSQPGAGLAPNSGLDAEITSPALNVRSGPGLNYAPQSILYAGDSVQVLGVNSLGAWYQVAQGGEIIGWISSRPDLVSVSGATDDLPVVAAPAGAAAVATGSQFILQAFSGGPVYLVDAAGNILRELPAGIDPTLSPDGNQIAYTRWDGADLGSLWVYDLNSGTERVILNDIRFQPKSPTWSPDGSEIVVNFQQGGRRQIEEVCTNSRNAQVPPNAFDVNFGSESGRICYKLPVDLEWKLRRVQVASGTYDDMSSANYSYAPTWDPANPWRVVFAAPRGLQQLDVNRDAHFDFGSDLNFRDRAPVFAPDGSAVAVSFSQDNFWEVYTIDATTGARTRLTQAPVLGDRYSSAAPAWSPDSRQIAFISNRSGAWQFWVMSADGSNQRPLFPAGSEAAALDIDYQGVDERLIIWK